MEIKKKIIADFLQKQPLYSKIEIDKHFFHPERFYELAFQFYCPNESNFQTFKLILEPETVITSLGRLPSNSLDFFDSFQKDKSIKFVHHFSGQCQYCKKYKVDFLLTVFSEGPIEDDNTGRRRLKMLQNAEQINNDLNYQNSKLYIRKIGQFPPFEINPEKEVINFLRDIDQEFYKKALICLSQSFGVGAYAYLRRLTENEIIRIVESLSDIDTNDGKEINNLYETYKVNKQMSNLIEGIFQYLPPGLKALNINPLKVLYGHLSEGIHYLTEEICLQRAFELDTILRFTIKKLNEEKTELKEIRNALKSLGH